MIDTLISVVLFAGVVFAVFFAVAMFSGTDRPSSSDSASSEPSASRLEEE